ncbi:MAG: D-ribose pyranase [Sporolactobacillus sp.]|jgi:D-ribose pyranase|nr:D-ribose pyranase [Sporolactobacillus sp.]
MKKTGVINSRMAAVISSMGHMDRLAIGDAGMPVPKETMKIDLAVEKSLPDFIHVLTNVLTELQIEKVYLAEEIKDDNPEQLRRITEIINVPIEFIPHVTMKNQLHAVKAFIRTGEMTPYSNIILESGVTF